MISCNAMAPLPKLGRRLANASIVKMPMASVIQSHRRCIRLSCALGGPTVKNRAATRQRSAMYWCVLGWAAILVAPASAREGDQPLRRLEISPQSLCIKGEIIHKTIPMSDLQVPLARIVDFDREPGLRPWIKLYGIGLPFYRSGWFLLKDREKALLALTTSNRAVYIPTCRGYALLLSPDHVEEFLAALQRPAPNGQVFPIVLHLGER
jgi:hypothetical protein